MVKSGKVIAKRVSPKEVVKKRAKLLANSEDQKTLKDLPDQFLSDGISQIDIILAYDDSFQSTPKGKTQRMLRQFYESVLSDEKGMILELEKSESNSGKTIGFIKVHAPYDVLSLQAESVGLKLPLKELQRPSLESKTCLEKCCRCDPST